MDFSDITTKLTCCELIPAENYFFEQYQAVDDAMTRKVSRTCREEEE